MKVGFTLKGKTFNIQSPSNCSPCSLLPAPLRLFERTTRIYILAGQSFEVEILPNERVRYL
ncbi:DUF6888 family protein [uncultured Nostoc sp.]|uniref:DUF6888 family protein n=1 Tax=uncultured Nostoc sp. TaxID=340711 RepID=UPI0035CAAFF3